MKRGRLNTSYRRRLLDQDLAEATRSIHGMVVDLGGEWKNRRGTFRPPGRADLRWFCLNLDFTVVPDIITDVARVPLMNACADAVVCTEVLEHVLSPEAVLLEAHRLLKPEGQLILSIPFLIGIHADPHDYQRYTRFKLEGLLGEVGFTVVEIHSQGLYFTVLTDLIRAGLARMTPAFLRWVLAVIFLPLANWLTHKEASLAHSTFISSHPGGYFVVARK